MRRAVLETTLRALRSIAPRYFSKVQSVAIETAPEHFVRDALWRIAHPDGKLFGRAPRDVENVYQFLAFAATRVPQLSGQFFQDLWALWETNDKSGGYFVEFGATDGKVLSNTYSLDTLKAGPAFWPNPTPHSPPI